jgi:hypothetical protein
MNRKRITRAAIYVIFFAALLIITLAVGRYVSKGTYADTNYVLLSATLMTGLTFYAISGIIRPRRR